MGTPIDDVLRGHVKVLLCYLRLILTINAKFRTNISVWAEKNKIIHWAELS